jgi:predicted TIM-barrel fold metal-dependent hydrolase
VSEHLTCAGDVFRTPDGSVKLPLPGLDDEEGPRVPDGLPPVIDAHVHLFPDRLFDAIWAWFHTHGWPIRYPLYSEDIIRFLAEHGIEHIVALHYAHKPGIARGLNEYVAALASASPTVTGLATVHPQDDDAGDILHDAFALGLQGVKLHCHVQGMPVDDPRLDDAYRAAADAGKPMVIHAGREPKSPAYKVDPYTICSVDRVARVLDKHPRLTLCVPHLGADEFEGYAALVRRSDRLWVDTTMVIGSYLPLKEADPLNLFGERMERVLYGSDFPILPYAWDRELKVLRDANLPDAALEAVCAGNARTLFRL